MLGFLFFWAVVAVACAIGIPIALSRVRARHRQEMMDLVLGRTGRAIPPSPAADSQQSGDVETALQKHTTLVQSMPEPAARRTAGATETAVLIQQLQDITAATKKKPSAQTEESAMLRRAERFHRETSEAVERESRHADRPQSRPSGPCDLTIHYVDANGVMTTRNVAPYKSGNTNEKFDAWCESRQDRRTFFFTRVQSGVDLRTRRPLSRAEVFSYVHPGRKVPADLR